MGRGGPGRALVVTGDSERGARLARCVAECTGADVTWARDLRTAWSLCGETPWRVVVADARLSDGPGLALLSLVRTHRAATATILLTEGGTRLDDSAVGGFLSACLAAEGAGDRLPAIFRAAGLRGATRGGPAGALSLQPLAPGQGQGFRAPRTSATGLGGPAA